jgi:dTDP-4-dehydrorhamnose 3,5-epimerase
MEIIKTVLPGVFEIIPKVFSDNRGWFYESFNLKALKEHGINFSCVQENHSYTAKKGTVRGLHFQQNPYAQTKIVRCTRGVIMDVAVDLRKNSPTYCKWLAVELSEENKKLLCIPKGFAHGFVSKTDDVEVQYLVDRHYVPSADRSVKFDDPDIGVVWGTNEPILSGKDKNAPLLRDSDCNF